MSHLPPVIGLAGFAKSGKDEVFKALESAGYTRVSFADGVRDALYALNPLVPLGETHVRYAALIDTVGYDEAKKLPEVRALLQRMGTEVGRKVIGPDVWAEAGRHKADQVLESGGKVVFTDVRFENEDRVLRDRDGDLWLVRRPGYGRINDHESEDFAEALDQTPEFAELVVDNDGTLADLRARVQDLVAPLV